MTAPNSLEARDKTYQMHPNVDLRRHEKIGSLVIERGEGVYVFDTGGKRYIEAMAGLWSVGLGFNERRLVEVAKAQMEKLPYYHTFAYKTHTPSIELAEKLIQMAPVPMSKVHFTSSGSEANDLVTKLTWYRSNALGLPQKKKMIGRIKGYHGVTIAAASLTGIARNHQSFDLPLPQMKHTTCPDFPRDAQPGETESDFVARMAADLEGLIEREGADTIAAFIRRAGHGCRRRDHSAKRILGGNPEGAEPPRHPADRGRSDLWFRAHREFIRLPRLTTSNRT